MTSEFRTTTYGSSHVFRTKMLPSHLQNLLSASAHLPVSGGHVVPLAAQYLQGFPLLMISSTYAKSMSGTQENQCIRPCKCPFLHTSRPFWSRMRVKNAPIS